MTTPAVAGRSAARVEPAASPRDLTWAAFTGDLAARGLTVLLAHRVPVQLWLADGDRVLHLLARGTRVTLRRYDRSDLVGLMLRSECDCAEHRTAGARMRVTLAPGAEPLAERVLDGAERYGWTGVEAGLAPLPLLSAAFEELRAALPADPPR